MVACMSERQARLAAANEASSHAGSCTIAAFSSSLGSSSSCKRNTAGKAEASVVLCCLSAAGALSCSRACLSPPPPPPPSVCKRFLFFFADDTLGKEPSREAVVRSREAVVRCWRRAFRAMIECCAALSCSWWERSAAPRGDSEFPVSVAATVSAGCCCSGEAAVLCCCSGGAAVLCCWRAAVRSRLSRRAARFVAARSVRSAVLTTSCSLSLYVATSYSSVLETAPL
mmetsp:Transcript_25603/g.59688  ORF Transcript_25603/g.59688 Transcript_25603/m.59688 type:complete len:228 (+) Transcript_25603:2812-3495(+)